MGRILTFNRLDSRTNDDRFSQRDLISKIEEIVTIKRYCNEVTRSVINSFVQNGLIETYNELGYRKWIEMISEAIDTEHKEGNYNGV